MKTVITLVTLSAALFSGYAAAQAAPERIKGALPADLRINLSAPVKVATCKDHRYREVFDNNKLSCERTIVRISDVKCPDGFPNFTARNVTTGSDRDLCAKASVHISSDGPLTNVTLNSDYVFVPYNGVRNGVSFVAADPDATASDGWLLDMSNGGSGGITDRYRRTQVVKATPDLVTP